MTFAIRLVAHDAPAPPCGLLATSQHLPDLAKRAPALQGFLLALCGADVILYHPDQADPDLPWLGDQITYLCRYGGGVYGPTGLRLTLPDFHLPRLHQEMADRHGIKGDLLVTAHDPLTLYDLAQARPVDQVDFDSLPDAPS